jgi:hypothetical protein
MAKLDELAAAKSSNKKQKKTSNSNLATPSISTIEGRERLFRSFRELVGEEERI